MIDPRPTNDDEPDSKLAPIDRESEPGAGPSPNGAAGTTTGPVPPPSLRAGGSSIRAGVPLWPYTWGRVFQPLRLPFELIYHLSVTRTIVRGGDQLGGLSAPVILAGTHHGFADMLLVRHGLARTPGRRLETKLVVAAAAKNWDAAPIFARYTALTFGLYPLGHLAPVGESFSGLVRLARRGHSILIFPQGHHTDPDHERRHAARARFHLGAAHLAGLLDAAVVPFGLAGTEKVLVQRPRRGSGFSSKLFAGEASFSLHRGPLAIVFGGPLRTRSGESSRDFSARLQRECFDLTARAESELGQNTT